jgi:leucyl-tRNA synthetase
MKYDFTEIEAKWQRIWEEKKEYATKNDTSKEKFYLLIEFPYPSGSGLHVGHPRSYVALDVVARKRRMEGYNVLYPIGFDSFGLPAENYAVKTGIHPAISTAENINNFRRQLKMLGISFDWDREIATSNPDYYKWTQWMFIRFFKAGLAYKTEMPINWCPTCKVTRANEEVINGNCELCNKEVERINKSQWMMRITDYADRLIDDLDTIDFIEPVKIQQRNWIGRSEGAEVDFKIVDSEEKLTVFTTRPDTIFGATYMVVAPEHSLVDRYADRIKNLDQVKEYRQQAARKSDFDRTEMSREKTGVPLEGLHAINPLTGEQIPIWISDYVLISYGSGAIMAVPGHDQRDWEFATRFELPIVEVISGGDISKEAYTDNQNGVLVNSDFINGLKVPQAIEKVIDFMEKEGIGKRSLNYKLRDWVFSRQRYWGEPIPLVQCEDCGWVPLPDSELPLELPEVDDYKPSDDGQSPLAKVTEWVNTTCPDCGKPAKRETDTMPQWAGSCWYFIRYLDPHNDEAFCDPDLLRYWLPVDWYNGGMEHTTLHLLYSRFWYKFLYDEDLVPSSEPYKRRTSHGMILGSDNEKMSKSRGNVVNPDDVVAEFGSDTMRTYEMYLGAFDQTTAWQEGGVIGIHRFLTKVASMIDKVSDDCEITEDDQRLIHKTIKAVDDRIERMKFNTAVAALIEFINEIGSRKAVNPDMLKTFVTLLFPFAPHLSSELWEKLGETESLTYKSWPEFDPELAKDDMITVPVQVNGKLRDTIEVPAGTVETDLFDQALASEKVQNFLNGREPFKMINVRGKLVNIVVK